MNLTFPLPDDIEEYNCIPIQGREFGGSWDDNKISYISLAVYLCENGANFGENEYQRKDGSYEYKYVDSYGKRHSVYSWKLVETDSTPAGKRCDRSLPG